MTSVDNFGPPSLVVSMIPFTGALIHVCLIVGSKRDTSACVEQWYTQRWWSLGKRVPWIPSQLNQHSWPGCRYWQWRDMEHWGCLWHNRRSSGYRPVYTIWTPLSWYSQDWQHRRWSQKMKKCWEQTFQVEDGSTVEGAMVNTVVGGLSQACSFCYQILFFTPFFLSILTQLLHFHYYWSSLNMFIFPRFHHAYNFRQGKQYDWWGQLLILKG